MTAESMARDSRPDPDDQTVAVVIPCYNEEISVGKVVRDFSTALPHADVYVIDNNSTDRTVEEAAKAGAIVVHCPEQGKGHVLRQMAQDIEADIYVVVDGDDTYPAEEAPRMIDKLLSERVDMVVGSRLRDYDEVAFRRFHLIGNNVISGMISFFFSTRLRDVLSGYRILSRRFVQRVPFRARGFEVETEMTLQALHKRLRVVETDIAYRSRMEGSVSKLTTTSDGLLILRSIMMLFRDYRPLLFFTWLGALFAISSLAAGFEPVRDYIETRYVLHVPRAILAAGLAVLSLLSLTAGLILDTISRLHLETLEMLASQQGKKR